jgi:hypothetical protein
LVGSEWPPASTTTPFLLILPFAPIKGAAPRLLYGKGISHLACTTYICTNKGGVVLAISMHTCYGVPWLHCLPCQPGHRRRVAGVQPSPAGVPWLPPLPPAPLSGCGERRHIRSRPAAQRRRGASWHPFFGRSAVFLSLRYDGSFLLWVLRLLAGRRCHHDIMAI